MSKGSKDQYHQAAVCFCGCTLERCLSQTDCLVVWVISKHPEHQLFAIGFACQALTTALQHVLSALPCLISISWP